jgi:hypothetical protein
MSIFYRRVNGRKVKCTPDDIVRIKRNDLNALTSLFITPHDYTSLGFNFNYQEIILLLELFRRNHMLRPIDSDRILLLILTSSSQRNIQRLSREIIPKCHQDNIYLRVLIICILTSPGSEESHDILQRVLNKSRTKNIDIFSAVLTSLSYFIIKFDDDISDRSLLKLAEDVLRLINYAGLAIDEFLTAMCDAIAECTLNPNKFFNETFFSVLSCSRPGENQLVPKIKKTATLETMYGPNLNQILFDIRLNTVTLRLLAIAYRFLLAHSVRQMQFIGRQVIMVPTIGVRQIQFTGRQVIMIPTIIGLCRLGFMKVDVLYTAIYSSSQFPDDIPQMFYAISNAYVRSEVSDDVMSYAARTIFRCSESALSKQSISNCKTYAKFKDQEHTYHVKALLHLVYIVIRAKFDELIARARAEQPLQDFQNPADLFDIIMPEYYDRSSSDQIIRLLMALESNDIDNIITVLIDISNDTERTPQETTVSIDTQHNNDGDDVAEPTHDLARDQI